MNPLKYKFCGVLFKVFGMNVEKTQNYFHTKRTITAVDRVVASCTAGYFPLVCGRRH